MQKIKHSSSLFSVLSSDSNAHRQVLLASSPALRVFAIPRCGDDWQLQWWTPLAGAVMPFTALSVVEQQQLLKVLAQQQSALASAVRDVSDTGQRTAAQQLSALLNMADYSRLYSVDGHPVMIDWHTDADTQLAAVSDVAADNAAVAMAASAARLAATKNTQRTKDWPRLVLVPLLILGFATAWWLSL